MHSKSTKKLQPAGLKRQLQAKSQQRRKRAAAETDVIAAQYRRGRNDHQPELRIVRRAIDSVRPAGARARVTTPEQLERVIKSIRQFGLVTPILIDAEDRIVSGHVVWEAAQKIGSETIECLVVDHLDDAELKALSLALNRIAETGDWNLDTLREVMIEIRSADIDLTTTGFTLQEFDQITLAPSPSSQDEEDCAEVEFKDETPVSRIGDLFQLNDHRLLCGDALEAESYRQVLGGRMAHCTFSDPPYGCKIEGFVSGLGKHKHKDFVMASGEMDDAQFIEFLETYLTHCRTFTSKGAVTFACMDWRQIDKLLAAGAQAGFNRNNIVVWNKGSGGMGSLYRSAHELIAVFCNGKSPATNNVELGRHGRDRSNLWSYPGANRRGSSANHALADHPTPKPIELVEDALLDITRPGDVVLDPFSGSGTTLIAAERCGRITCGIELDPQYVDRTIRRWERMTGHEVIHVESGMTFTELMTERQKERNSSPTPAPGQLEEEVQ